MKQIRYSIEVSTGTHTANLRTIDHSLARWFLQEMAQCFMEQVEAEYPNTKTIPVEEEN
jgi:hypothetical protein